MLFFIFTRDLETGNYQFFHHNLSIQETSKFLSVFYYFFFKKKMGTQNLLTNLIFSTKQLLLQ